MLLGGLWHGANWTFVLWGCLHGVGLVVNQTWRRLRRVDRHASQATAGARHWLGRCATLLFVVVTWVLFRAEDTSSAWNIVSGMAGMNGIVLPATYAHYLGALADPLADAGIRFETGFLFLGVKQVVWLAGLLAIVWLLPNSAEWVGYAQDPAILRRRLAWQPSIAWSIALSGITVISLFAMSQTGEFLYFQF